MDSLDAKLDVMQAIARDHKLIEYDADDELINKVVTDLHSPDTPIDWIEKEWYPVRGAIYLSKPTDEFSLTDQSSIIVVGLDSATDEEVGVIYNFAVPGAFREFTGSDTPFNTWSLYYTVLKSGAISSGGVWQSKGEDRSKVGTVGLFESIRLNARDYESAFNILARELKDPGVNEREFYSDKIPRID